MRWGVGRSGTGAHQPPATGSGCTTLSLAALEESDAGRADRLVAGTINASRM